ncbi:unnamed protein product [Durusdinium trenchii]|uniref:RING-type domain-containing protein n=1 Tax=Durusdinium trenchii TaxID=1381693 RepID=A0ABP0QUK6_9DINO
MGTIAGTCRSLMFSLQALTGGSRHRFTEQHRFLDAAKAGDFERVRLMLEERPELVNCQPCQRWSALHYAAHKGNLVAVQFLLEKGASLTLRTREGLTPAEVAASSLFEYLLYASLQAAAAEEAKSKKCLRCATDDDLQSLILWRFSAAEIPPGSEDERCCQICLEDFAENEELRKLPCGHSFHSKCVDEWLTEKSCSCPICRADCADHVGPPES